MAIHRTAVIDTAAEIDPSAEIGPYVVIRGKVKIASGVRVIAQAFLAGNTEIGPDCVIHPFAVLGHEPQHLTWKREKSYLKIGRGNIFREGCSVHRGSQAESSTIIGDNNFLMGYSHVGHDCLIGNEVIIANGVLLAGHVQVEDKAFISGNVSIHQFVRIGALTMIGGMSRVIKDVPPYMMLEGNSTVRGINVVGLRRAGFTPPQRIQVKRAYKLLYHSGFNVTQAVEAIEKEDLGPGGARIVEFIRNSRRGICRHA